MRNDRTFNRWTWSCSLSFLVVLLFLTLMVYEEQLTQFIAALLVTVQGEAIAILQADRTKPDPSESNHIMPLWAGGHRQLQ